MEQQKENNQIVDEYINVLTSKLNEVTQESLVLKAQLNSVKKERDLLIEKVRELSVKEDEMKKPQSDFQNS
jgi:septal ring factor EnvC (AmiA/AmiB activator)